MKTEVLLNKEEVGKVMLKHILDSDLVTVDGVTINGTTITIDLDPVDITADEVRGLIQSLVDDEPVKQTIIITPDGSLGVESEINVED